MRTILLGGASLMLAIGLAACQSPRPAPNKAMGYKMNGVTGTTNGMNNSSAMVPENAPAMPSSAHTVPAQRQTTQSQTMDKSSPSTQPQP